MCECSHELSQKVEDLNDWAIKHEKANTENFKMVLDAIAENTQIGNETAQQVNQLSTDTAWFVETKKDLAGTYRIGLKVQKGIKWLSGFAILGLVIDWLIKHFS